MNAGQKAARILQIGQTQRWHTEINLKAQDVAQHSFNVAWLCWLLTRGEASGALLLAALAHDAGERKTGDMPAPTKIKLDVGKQMDFMESAYLAKMGFMGSQLSAEDAQTLKLADAFDGAFFCLRELMLGNRLVLDKEWNGASLNYMEYLRLILPEVKSQPVSETGYEMFNYLTDQYAKHRPHFFPRRD